MRSDWSGDWGYMSPLAGSAWYSYSYMSPLAGSAWYSCSYMASHTGYMSCSSAWSYRSSSQTLRSCSQSVRQCRNPCQLAPSRELDLSRDRAHVSQCTSEERERENTTVDSRKKALLFANNYLNYAMDSPTCSSGCFRPTCTLLYFLSLYKMNRKFSYVDLKFIYVIHFCAFIYLELILMYLCKPIAY